MVEVMFEILLFSAYLSAALISVVIAVYAISVSYLGRETSRSIWTLKRRQREVKNRIKKLGEKIDVGEMEEEIRRYRREETTLNSKLRFLSFNGAVLLPLAALFVALFLSLVGVFVHSWSPEYSGYYIALSLIANATGIAVLFKILKTVEWAALRVPLPKFEVFFKSYLREEKMMPDEEKNLQFLVCNHGDVMAEDVEIFVCFPPNFKVTSKPKHYHIVMQSKGSDYPGYNALNFGYDKIHVNIEQTSSEIAVKAPEKRDKYRIPICIYERNTGEFECELFIEVVD